jgi:hypothetical protein
MEGLLAEGGETGITPRGLFRQPRIGQNGGDPPFRYFQKSAAQFGPTDRSTVEAKALHYMIISFINTIINIFKS